MEPKGFCRAYMKPAPNPKLRKNNPVHTLTSYTTNTGRTHRVDTSFIK